MDSKALAQRWIAIPRNCQEPVDEIDDGGFRGEVERVPRELRRAGMHTRVEREEGGLELVCAVDSDVTYVELSETRTSGFSGSLDNTW